MMQDDTEIGRHIYDLRIERDVQQGELAKAIHMHQSVLNRIEKGTRPARDNEIRAIALFFRVSADELLGLDTARLRTFYPSAEETTGGSMVRESRFPHRLATKECELLRKYLELDERGKATVHGVICDEWNFVMREG